MRQARREILSLAIQQPKVYQLIGSAPLKLQVQHPLLKRVYNWGEKEAVEQELKVKTSLFLSAVREEDWQVCVNLLRPRYRMNFLNSIYDRCSLNKFCELLRFIFTDGSPLKSQSTLFYRTIKRLKARKAEGQDYQPLIMSPEELTRFNDLPDQILVWRGSGDCDLGWAWSFDRFVARWHASQCARTNPRKQGFVHKAWVMKEDIFALLSDQPVGQETVIINPRALTVISSKPFGVECRYRSPEKRYLDKVKPEFVLSKAKPAESELLKSCSDENRQAVMQWAQECLEKQARRAGHKESPCHGINFYGGR